jgi:hypothetical protein
MSDEDPPNLVETQGVNAGRPVDAEPRPTDPRNSAPAEEPPDEPDVPGNLTDEMAGVPQERSGYPGQHRSVDTS